MISAWPSARTENTGRMKPGRRWIRGSAGNGSMSRTVPNSRTEPEATAPPDTGFPGDMYGSRRIRLIWPCARSSSGTMPGIFFRSGTSNVSTATPNQDCIPIPEPSRMSRIHLKDFPFISPCGRRGRPIRGFRSRPGGIQPILTKSIMPEPPGSS